MKLSRKQKNSAHHIGIPNAPCLFMDDNVASIVTYLGGGRQRFDARPDSGFMKSSPFKSDQQ
jgi:hypothetical protein